MKSTGIVRRVDELGRIVLPMETRRSYGINPKDAIEIFTDEDSIILKKYQAHCVFCSNVEKLINFKGKKVCKECLASVSKGLSDEHNS